MDLEGFTWYGLWYTMKAMYFYRLVVGFWLKQAISDFQNRSGKCLG